MRLVNTYLVIKDDGQFQEELEDPNQQEVPLRGVGGSDDTTSGLRNETFCSFRIYINPSIMKCGS